MKIIAILFSVILFASCGVLKSPEHGYGGTFGKPEILVSNSGNQIKTERIKLPSRHTDALVLIQNRNLHSEKAYVQVQTKKLVHIQKKLIPHKGSKSNLQSLFVHHKKTHSSKGPWGDIVCSFFEGLLAIIMILAALYCLGYGIFGYALLVPTLASVSGVGFFNWFLFAFNSTLYSSIAIEIAFYLLSSLLLLLGAMGLLDVADSVALWIIIGVNALLLIHMWPQFLFLLAVLVVLLLLGMLADLTGI